jgi:VIT1/CCC1 family predicted Fe2+/Mn2+ transporter
VRFDRGAVLLPLVLGLIDGILNALTLAAGALLDASRGVTVGLSFRIGAAAFATAGFAFFVAKYAELRGGLVRAGRQLSLRDDQPLQATDLGSLVRSQALAATAVACFASFLGALLPLLAGALLPGPAWLAVALALLVLAGLGFGLASVLEGSRARWVIGLLAGGVVLTAIGAVLKIA